MEGYVSIKATYLPYTPTMTSHLVSLFKHRLNVFLGLASQQDLTVNDLRLSLSSRRGSTSAASGGGSHNTAGGEDTPDTDVRGQELAARCWNEDEEFLGKEKIAEWLGGKYVVFASLPVCQC